jgi:thymidylate synthase (FAD)
LVSITPEAEKVIAYCARVSSPKNQDNPQIASLLRYCIKNGHWSIFEQANLVLEIETSRAISAQILRHRSFSFQEFSQRYSKSAEFIQYGARRQDEKNRQSSHDDLSPEDKKWFLDAQADVWDFAFQRYEAALARGVAKECARFLLPLNTATKIYMNGTVRSWIHYLQLRTEVGTQMEHREIAERCKAIFVSQLPTISEALGWAGSGDFVDVVKGDLSTVLTTN